MNKKLEGHPISKVDPGSIGEELELEPGDRVLTINGNPVEDIFDYEYYVNSPSMTMVVRKANGEEWELDIENDYEDLGLTFENGLMSDYRSCSNKCIFCFIDQMPPGMRETLYFKDDDTRLSFLQGNYVTLTNLKDKDVERIIRFKLAPINISVQTTNPELRCMMLHNRFAGRALKIIDRLYEAETPMNGQIVLCKGVNDGAELERSISDLSKYAPVMQSVSVVPVGLSKYRDGLYPLEPFTKEDACATIDMIERWQKKIYAEHGIHFIHASDEFYTLAERKLPEKERYDGYIQLENGVGMMRLYASEFLAELEKPHRIYGTKKMDVVTGEMASPLIRQMMAELHRQYPMVEVTVHTIKNKFFGGNVGVAGLVTATDIIAQCEGKLTSGTLGVPAVMLREEKDTFLDDITTDQLAQRLGVKVEVLPTSGGDEARALLRSGLHIARRRRA